MPETKSIMPLPEAVATRNHEAIALWLEESAAWHAGKVRAGAEAMIVSGMLEAVAPILQAAATYRLVVAQEQTAYLLQRLVDAAERDK